MSTTEPTYTRAPRAATDTPVRALSRLGPPGIIAVTVIAAVAVNLVIWLIGALAGGDFEYTDGGSTMSAAPGGVIVLTAVPLAIGLAIAALVARRRPRLIRVAQIVGSLLAVGTIAGTVATDFDGPSTVALSLTHLTLVPALVIALEAIGSRVRR